MPRPRGLHLRPGPDHTSEIDALADLLGGRVGDGVLQDLDRQGRRSWAPGRAVDRAWTFDCADRRDLRWWPQGIDTRVDTSGSTVAITWYAKKLPGDRQSQGSRITLFDLESRRYRHVLLVRPTLIDGVPGLVPLRVHAGGLVWHGRRLHVAATGKGWWTCLLDDVISIPDGHAVREHSFGYRYVLPVRTSYQAAADEGVEKLRYSFFSRDASDLIIGEYGRGSSSRRLVRIALDAETSLPVADPEGIALPEVIGDGVGHMQGAVRVDGRWYATTSHGRSRLGSVWTGEPGALTRHRWATPMGPEDLSHDPVTDTLWSVTEHPWARWIYTMKRSWFDLRP
ncbi:MAG: hypothetical protein WB471_06240 [Nocardioides sp.]